MDPYAVLGLTPDVSVSEAEAAYDRLAERLERTRLRSVRGRRRAKAVRRLEEVTDAIRAIREAHPEDALRVGSVAGMSHWHCSAMRADCRYASPHMMAVTQAA